jgi:Mg2+ and Co2+ transporter CorA
MFGFKRRHRELLYKLKEMDDKFDVVTSWIAANADDIRDIQRKNETLYEALNDNAKRLNTMMNEFKGAIAMARAALMRE